MRLPKLRTFAYLFVLIRRSYFLSPLQTALRERTAHTKRPTQDAAIVLVQCVEDYFYFGLFSRFVAGLRACGPLQVEQYSLRSLRVGSSLSLRRFFWNSIAQNLMSDWKWRRLYRAFADRTAYCAAGWVAPWTALRLWGAAFRLWRSLKNADDLAGLTIRDIWVGDLIIDSYIRFKPTPALNLADAYLWIVIRQCLKDLEKAFAYFGKTKPALLLTSYTTYIQHGVHARVAAHLGVKVLTFSNMQEWTTEITPASPWQTRSGASYKQAFSALPDQPEKIEMAKRLLEARLEGKTDSATAYMKASAYGQKKDMAIEVNGMPVIFLHDFTDSIHIYRWITFHDFWNWVCFTIDTLRAAGIAFVVKPHPNQTADDTGALDLLHTKYRDLKFIPPDISNRQLVDAGMSCAITVYGTVASEMAFMGVPTISSGDHPHISFDFCRTARSPAEYASALVGHRDPGQAPDDMRRESCIFYYMHNLNLDPGQKTLRDEMLEFRRKLFFVTSTPPLPDILIAMERFGSGPEFEAFFANLYRDLNGSRQTRDYPGKDALH